MMNLKKNVALAVISALSLGAYAQSVGLKKGNRYNPRHVNAFQYATMKKDDKTGFRVLDPELLKFLGAVSQEVSPYRGPFGRPLFYSASAAEKAQELAKEEKGTFELPEIQKLGLSSAFLEKFNSTEGREVNRTQALSGENEGERAEMNFNVPQEFASKVTDNGANSSQPNFQELPSAIEKDVENRISFSQEEQGPEVNLSERQKNEASVPEDRALPSTFLQKVQEDAESNINQAQQEEINEIEENPTTQAPAEENRQHQGPDIKDAFKNFSLADHERFQRYRKNKSSQNSSPEEESLIPEILKEGDPLTPEELAVFGVSLTEQAFATLKESMNREYVPSKDENRQSFVTSPKKRTQLDSDFFIPEHILKKEEKLRPQLSQTILENGMKRAFVGDLSSPQDAIQALGLKGKPIAMLHAAGIYTWAQGLSLDQQSVIVETLEHEGLDGLLEPGRNFKFAASETSEQTDRLAELSEQQFQDMQDLFIQIKAIQEKLGTGTDLSVNEMMDFYNEDADVEYAGFMKKYLTTFNSLEEQAQEKGVDVKELMAAQGFEPVEAFEDYTHGLANDTESNNVVVLPGKEVKDLRYRRTASAKVVPKEKEERPSKDYVQKRITANAVYNVAEIAEGVPETYIKEAKVNTNYMHKSGMSAEDVLVSSFKLPILQCSQALYDKARSVSLGHQASRPLYNLLENKAIRKLKATEYLADFIELGDIELSSENDGNLVSQQELERLLNQKDRATKESVRAFFERNEAKIKGIGFFDTLSEEQKEKVSKEWRSRINQELRVRSRNQDIDELTIGERHQLTANNKIYSYATNEIKTGRAGGANPLAYLSHNIADALIVAPRYLIEKEYQDWYDEQERIRVMRQIYGVKGPLPRFFGKDLLKIFAKPSRYGGGYTNFIERNKDNFLAQRPKERRIAKSFKQMALRYKDRYAFAKDVTCNVVDKVSPRMGSHGDLDEAADKNFFRLFAKALVLTAQQTHDPRRSVNKNDPYDPSRICHSVDEFELKLIENMDALCGAAEIREIYDIQRALAAEEERQSSVQASASEM